MEKLRDKYILGFSILIFGYILFRWYTSHTLLYMSCYDIHIIFLCILMYWYIYYNHRIFVMSIKRLSRYNRDSYLEYCRYVTDKGGTRNIYVRVLDYGIPSEWYELDYIATISQHCSEKRFNDFASEYNTVGKLIDKMNSEICMHPVYRDYHSMKYEYNCYRWLTFSFLLLSYFIVCLTYFNYGS